MYQAFYLEDTKVGQIFGLYKMGHGLQFMPATAFFWIFPNLTSFFPKKW